MISWQKAMLLWFQEKVDVLEFHQYEVHSEKKSFRLPSVMKLKNYVKPWIQGPVKLSRENIYLRDKHTCQYCHKVFKASELTLDHVVPSSRGGENSWTNLVAACQKCNHKKGNRTPKEAKMPLLKPPQKPSWRPSIQLSLNIENIAVEAWRNYVYD